MNELVGRLSDSLVSDSTDLDAQFEARLADSFALAFRIAFSVLRQRQDAEDIAQEAFVKAHRYKGPERLLPEQLAPGN